MILKYDIGKDFEIDWELREYIQAHCKRSIELFAVYLQWIELIECAIHHVWSYSFIMGVYFCTNKHGDDVNNKIHITIIIVSKFI